MKRRRAIRWILLLTMGMISIGIVASNYLPYVVAQTVPTLQYGARGDQVVLLQQRLQAWGYYSGVVDGVFGDETLEAVRFFQRRNGLAADGVVGRQTWAALGLLGRVTRTSQPVQASGSSVGNRNDSLELLARVIAAEAQGEPYIGQVAVGAVILNRVRDPDFPNTLAGVIYQPHAFESVSNGLIWRRNPTEEAWRAAQDALNGWDPTYGSLFFWNPYKPVSAWIWSRPIVIQYGNHVFAH